MTPPFLAVLPLPPSEAQSSTSRLLSTIPIFTFFHSLTSSTLTDGQAASPPAAPAPSTNRLRRGLSTRSLTCKAQRGQKGGYCRMRHHGRLNAAAQAAPPHMRRAALMGGEETHLVHGWRPGQTQRAREAASEVKLVCCNALYTLPAGDAEPRIPCFCITSGPGSRVLWPLLLYMSWALLSPPAPGLLTLSPFISGQCGNCLNFTYL